MVLHIGKEIEDKYKESGMKLSEFAKRMNTSSRNVYDIFARAEIKTDQLKKVGQVLGYNFFNLYQDFAQEPPLTPIGKPKAAVSVVVELDGQEATLQQWVQRLTALNKAMS